MSTPFQPPGAVPVAAHEAPPVTGEGQGNALPGVRSEAADIHESASTGGPSVGDLYRGGLSTGSGRFRATLGKHRFWLVVGALFVLVTLTLFVLGSREQRSAGELAADNPAPEGAMAAVQILRQRGVSVTATDTLAATLSTVQKDGAAATTVLLFDPSGLLDHDQLQRLAGTGSTLVLVEPGPLTLAGVGGSITVAGAASFQAATAAAACGMTDAEAAGAISADGGTVYRGPVTCFPDGGTPDSGGAMPDGAGSPAGGPADTGDRAGLYAASADGRTIVLGNRAVLSNDKLGTSGNAALALRTLGKARNLLWYTPSLQDLAQAETPKDLAQLTPEWRVPAGIWLLIVAVLGMLWKGRRDGPLVPEPLPVVVQASETAAGRARLYQDAGAVGTAAASLRAGSLLRMAHHLRLGPGASRDDVVASISAQTGRSAEELTQLIQAKPGTDAALLRWARDLDVLEKEVTSR
ncbi:DUF4350 domain-containing protein [Paenarthrobacter sp. PH39-S1]|uniref:DUF4350 domain-containing protein n=1 Tax=Paenarthrobacter sp. PH39-S1 TaxID=3046204 RepID=UPI0024B93623|nr:DUF4350 domain-containing protein [Paenarthrobacter sp. PH39-S1]MDJ0356455.1 DUF4350 domain-containing protein [Paenarthrobacter sp. PH39-S1]